MSNEEFFLEVCKRGYLKLCNKEPQIENGMRIYHFDYYGANPVNWTYIVATNRITFNQIGGFVSLEELEDSKQGEKQC